VIRKSQLLQAGVVMDAGPTLDEIHAQEARSAAELKAKKAAALAEAMEDEESEEETTEEVAEAPAEVAEAPEPVEEAPAVEEVVEEAPAEASTDYSSMTVAQLKELLKEAGKPVSGKKAELIERLQE
ncbi:MAG: hypothetical protein DWC00_01160, partial [Candidatus Poseidoniales archaeon]